MIRSPFITDSHSYPTAPGLRDLYRGRCRLIAWVVVPALALGLSLRIVLYAAFHDGTFRLDALLCALAIGALYDFALALVVGTPILFGLAVLRLRLLARPLVRGAVLATTFTLLVFHAVAEFYFFEEFNARFNHIALDYVLFPTEVFVNIWESYDVVEVVLSAALLGSLLAWTARRSLRSAAFPPPSFAARWRAGTIALATSGAAFLMLLALPEQTSANRITSEIAQNGTVQLVRAYLTAELDHALYYATLPRAEARRRAAIFLGFAEPTDVGLAVPAEVERWERRFEPATHPGRPLDVVVVLEESFGSQFVGALGQGEQNLTPCFDRWAQEGLLLENLVATGNRTVRGLEGVLCSFVPLPGDSVVRRARSENVATLARVFREQGYKTGFFYGGYALFDGMKGFFSANGWEDIFDQPDFRDDAFRTIWGVADEFIFDALLARQKLAAKRGEPLFATMLSVSNHKPYDVPPGRSQVADALTGRRRAVAYSDWCIGRYLDQARDAGLLEHTVVLVVGDHGARVYGSEKIPAPSYRIPALFITPDLALRGRTISRLCSQIDLAPTLLSLAGIDCEAPFFGSDLIGLPDEGGRAFLHHNRDIGLLTDDTLVVLGLQKAVEFYTRSDRGSDRFTAVDPTAVTPPMRELEKNAVAVFQTAYELYQNRRFVLPDLLEIHPTQ